MREPIQMSGFNDRNEERNALIEVHKKCLVALLDVVHHDPGNKLLRVQCVRFLDEALWAVTEITPGRKHDTRFVSEGVKAMLDEHNKLPSAWRYTKEPKKWHARKDPRKCAQHEHVVTRKELQKQLFKAGPNSDAVEKILRLAIGCLVTREEHDLLALHDKSGALGWERYARAPVKVWDRSTGDWRCED